MIRLVVLIRQPLGGTSWNAVFDHPYDYGYKSAHFLQNDGSKYVISHGHTSISQIRIFRKRQQTIETVWIFEQMANFHRSSSAKLPIRMLVGTKIAQRMLGPRLIRFQRPHSNPLDIEFERILSPIS